MTLDPKVQRIIEWRESMTTLEENRFFAIMKMYLGEIKTPYNKQNLVQSLGSFLAKKENLDTIRAYLSENDVEILSAVRFIPDLTFEKLTGFFTGTYSYARLAEQVDNLEERLLIYRHKNDRTGKHELKLNPVLEEVLLPVTDISKLLPVQKNCVPSSENSFYVSSQVIASYVCLASEKKDMCKADGTFKKRAVADLQNVFAGGKENKAVLNGLQLLSNALRNLMLVYENDEGTVIDWQRLDSFAASPELEQKLYVCVASAGHFSRSTMQKNAQLLFNLLECMRKVSLTRPLITRLLFLVQSRNGAESSGTSRFARMLERAEGNSADVKSSGDAASTSVMESVLDSAIDFGLLQITGKNERNENLYSVSPVFVQLLENRNPPHLDKVLSVDAGFSCTVMPGLSLKELLDLTKGMEVTGSDVASNFELTKKSLMRIFDLGWTPEKYISLLEDFSLYAVPQSLKVSIEEWYSNYSSASIYKGYVLKVNEENRALVEKNPSFSQYITLELAPGVFLLNVQSDEEMKSAVAKSGLDFLGSIKTSSKEREILSLPSINMRGVDFSFDFSQASVFSENINDSSKISQDLMQALDRMEATPDQKEELQDRINRKVVLSEKQLVPSTVVFERLEAGGMDFAGKLHVLNSAISSGSMVAVETEQEPMGIAGVPLAVIGRGEDAMLRLKLQDTNECVDFYVAQLVHVKKLRSTYVAK